MSKSQVCALTARSLETGPARHGFFTRTGGASSGVYEGLNVGLGSADDTDTVRENRRRAADHLLPGAPLCTPYQVHGTDVMVLTEPWPDTDPPHADAVVTSRPGVAIGVVTADCVPVLLATTGGGIIGAAHAGWKGALNGILEQTIAAMEQLGARREEICAAIGPAIAQSSYEVGPELLEAFKSKDPSFGTFFAANDADRYQLDLVGFVGARLQSGGIGQISTVSCDTYLDAARFYSYRRTCHLGEDDYGRQLSAIVLPDYDDRQD